MQLVASLTSPFVRKCRIVLAEKGLPCALVDGFADQRAALRRANPLGKVPCLVLDDGEPVFDSAVIVEYLDAAHPAPRLIPDEPRARMRVRRWEALADGLGDAAVLLMLERRKPAALRDAATLAAQAQKLADGLAFADRALAGRAFAEGHAFSLADAALASAIGYVDYRVADVRDPALAELARWYQGLAGRPSIAGTAPPQPPPEPMSPAVPR